MTRLRTRLGRSTEDRPDWAGFGVEMSSLRLLAGCVGDGWEGTQHSMAWHDTEAHDVDGTAALFGMGYEAGLSGTLLPPPPPSQLLDVFSFRFTSLVHPPSDDGHDQPHKRIVVASSIRKGGSIMPTG